MHQSMVWKDHFHDKNNTSLVSLTVTYTLHMVFLIDNVQDSEVLVI